MSNKQPVQTDKVVEQRKRGRPKGSQNKTTVALKEGIMQAYNNLGGVAYLEKVGREDPKTFCTLLGKVLPQEMKADLTSTDGSMSPVRIELVAVDDNSSD